MRDLGTVEKITDASLLFTLADNTTFTLDGDTIALGGLSFDTATSVDGQFTIGGAVTGQMSVTLMNADDSLSEYDFRDAHIVASIVGLDENDDSTSIQVGLYTVNEFTYNGSNISLVAYDYMSKFDFPCTDLGNLASLTFPLTLTELVQNACTACGVTLVSPSNPIPNGTYSITQQPAQWNTMTWHDVISACAQLGGCYAKVDKYGRLYFDWYTVPSSANTYDGGTFNTTTTPYSDGDPLDGGTFSYTDGTTADGGTFGDRANYHVIPAPYALTVDTDDVYITGLKVTLNASDNINAGESTDTYTTTLSGSEGYVVTISGNPFIETTSNADTIRDYLASIVVGMLFRPMQATIVEDPTIEAGDTAIVTGRGNEQYQCFISHVTYTVSAATTIACDAEATSLSSKTRFTQSDKANTTITQIKKDLSSVTRIAGNTNQYFWHTETGTDTGAHITEVTQDEWNDSSGQYYHSGGNLLARSNGIAIRDGLTELATFSANGVSVGQSGQPVIGVNTDGFSIDDEDGVNRFFVGKPSNSVTAVKDIKAFNISSLTYTMSHTIYEDSGVTVTADNGTAITVASISGSTVVIQYPSSTTNITSLTFEYYTADTIYSYWFGNNPGSVFGNEAVSECGGQACGDYSHAGGGATSAGKYSFAQGNGSIAVGDNQTVIGVYNDTSYYKKVNGGTYGFVPYVFIIGNGTSDSARSNALTVDWDGNVTAAGSIKDKLITQTYTNASIVLSNVQIVKSGRVVTLTLADGAAQSVAANTSLLTLDSAFAPAITVEFADIYGKKRMQITTAGVIKNLDALTTYVRGTVTYISAT